MDSNTLVITPKLCLRFGKINKYCSIIVQANQRNVQFQMLYMILREQPFNTGGRRANLEGLAYFWTKEGG